MMGRSFGSLLSCLLLVVTSGCYEGWENKRLNDDGNEQPEPTEPIVRPIFYTLVEVYALSDAAMLDPTCFPTAGVREYRAEEWNRRTTAIIDLLQSLSHKIVVKDIEIADDDCQSFGTIEGRAVSAAPWAPDEEPRVDNEDRPLVHVKIVLWDEDHNADPSSLVTTPNWVAWQTLANSGRNAISAAYFSLTTVTEGYITKWRDTLGEDEAYTATPISLGDVAFDPSPEGINARDAIIINDTAGFREWLTAKF